MVGIADLPVGVGWSVFTYDKLNAPLENDMSIISTNYQVFFPARGVSFPVGKRFRPSVHAHALIFDPDYGGGRWGRDH